MDSLDIIGKLRSVDHVLEKIFESFDYHCLKRAEMVSPVWEEAIRNTKLWKKLFVSNCETPKWRRTLSALNGISHKDLPLQQGMTEDHPDYHRKLFCLIESEAKLLEYNWSTMKHEDKDKMFDVSSSKLSFGPIHSLDSTGNLLIVLDNSEREILLVNRWTLQIEKVLEFPIMQIRYNLLDPNVELRDFRTLQIIRPEDSNPTISSVEVNENFIIATLKDFQTEICVWDAKTYDLLRVLDYNDIYWGRDSNMSNGLYCNEPVCHCLRGNLLLTCHFTRADCHRFLLMRLPDDLGEDGEPDVLSSQFFSDDFPYRIVGMSFDENFIILHYEDDWVDDETDEEESGTRYEIYSTFSFEYMRTINHRDWYEHFDYRKQMIVSASSRTKCIGVFNVETGACVRKISQSDEICAVNFVNDKYFFTCDTTGKCRVWDLPATINNSITKHKLVLKTIPSPFSQSSSDKVSIQFAKADEYQIIIGGICSDAQGRRQTRVFTKTFLGVI